MTLHIFNPENDMALADGKPGYTAPDTIRQMRSELYWLPSWWAAEGDQVWDGESPVTLSPGDEISPWGWSPALIHRLRQAGVAPEFMPDEEEMRSMRALSHRATAVEALARQRADGLLGARMRGSSELCHSWEEVERLLSDGRPRVLKTPWSSSGKGVALSSSPGIRQWCQKAIGRQGSVVVEDALEKFADFAFEFSLDGSGGVQYQGLSLFYTGKVGSYTGNWVAPEGEKMQWLLQYVPLSAMVEIRHWWESYLSRFNYRGPVGVDMMVCRDGVCPCIEINWRQTMGMVANRLAAQGKYGRLIVEYIYGHYSAEVEAFG